ncbi:MAG: L-seryl-tRNA(Sec) selenium transferase [Phenylobacterium sp.]
MTQETRKADRTDPRRRLPAVGALCDSPEALPLKARFGAEAVTRAVRAVLAEARARLPADPEALPSPAGLLAAAGARLEAGTRETLFPVINATGVVIHTNLGRAPLAPEALEAVRAAAGYANLEIDLDTGRRSSRHVHLDPLIAEATGAEAGLAVNNCAGAVLLALAALADGAPVIVSRGELVEIGGGFRVPDVVAQGGSRLVEVGTTNRTHLRDYEKALAEHPDARVILRTHPSNFRITGFTSAPSPESLAHFAHAHGLLLIEDLGGGALVDLAPFGVPDEPTVQASLQAGADLVLFSGDKLLGGPQAGLAAGRRALVDRLEAPPLARALRLDKLSAAALAATLRLYRPPSDPVQRIPVLRMLAQEAGDLALRTADLAARLGGLADLDIEAMGTEGFAGGGALPMRPLAGRALALRSARLGAEDLALRLRTGRIRVLGRIEQDRVFIDLRTVDDAEVPALATAIAEAAGEIGDVPLRHPDAGPSPG